jgi:hypothetical protein
MRRFLSAWVALVILEVVSLRVAVAFSPVIFSPFSSFGSISVFTGREARADDPLLQEPTSASQELDLLCEQESKHVSVLAHFHDLCLTAQQRATSLRSISAQDLPSLLFFFPRKLLPSNNDPLLG